jgi:hypothetical protein
VACGHAARLPSGPTSTPLGQPFDVRVRTAVVIESESLRVAFDAVLSDSRCPTGVTCVWAGDAHIRVLIQQDRQEAAALELHTHPTFAREADYRGYRVLLQAVAPYPAADQSIPPDAYVATLVVTRP